MLLGFLTVLLMLVAAYVFWREGLLTAVTMTCNVFAAGVVAFNFWEPIADQLDPLFADSFLHGYEDALCLIVLFALTLGLLRLITNNLAKSNPDYPAWLNQGGSAVCGLVAGYLAAGFLLCMMQTLPMHENFMGFDYSVEKNWGGSRTPKVLPPDHVYLALMHGTGFDPKGTFELRYARFRRYENTQDALPYQGEVEP